MIVTKLPGSALFIYLCCTGCGARPRADGSPRKNWNQLSLLSSFSMVFLAAFNLIFLFFSISRFVTHFSNRWCNGINKAAIQTMMASMITGEWLVILSRNGWASRLINSNTIRSANIPRKLISCWLAITEWLISRKKILKQPKGFYCKRKNVLTVAKNVVEIGMTYMFVGRKLKKRNYRQLWIARIKAACREEGITYSEFINKLQKKGIELDRKVLADLAMNNPETFKNLVAQVK